MEQIIKTSAPIASAVAIVLFALPSYISVLRQRGLAKGGAILGVLGLFAFIVEALAVKTGLIYGGFQYAQSVGYRVVGTAPWLVIFATPPIMLGAFWLASKVTTSKWRVLLTAIFSMPLYVTIAPAVTRMSIWQWEASGLVFGVPVQPFIAWFLLSLGSGFILARLWDEDAPLKRGLAFSAFMLLWFWGGVNLGLEQYIPGAVGIVAGLILVFFMRREKKAKARNPKISS